MLGFQYMLANTIALMYISFLISRHCKLMFPSNMLTFHISYLASHQEHKPEIWKSSLILSAPQPSASNHLTSSLPFAGWVSLSVPPLLAMPTALWPSPQAGSLAASN